jgi:hypothetical protein
MQDVRVSVENDNKWLFSVDGKKVEIAELKVSAPFNNDWRYYETALVFSELPAEFAAPTAETMKKLLKAVFVKEITRSRGNFSIAIRIENLDKYYSTPCENPPLAQDFLLEIANEFYAEFKETSASKLDHIMLEMVAVDGDHSICISKSRSSNTLESTRGMQFCRHSAPTICRTVTKANKPITSIDIIFTLVIVAIFLATVIAIPLFGIYVAAGIFGIGIVGCIVTSLLLSWLLEGSPDKGEILKIAYNARLQMAEPVRQMQGLAHRAVDQVNNLRASKNTGSSSPESEVKMVV